MNNRFRFRFWNNLSKQYENTYDLKSCEVLDYVIPEQCTGSKDNNSKLIYEGDIIKTPNGSIGYIVWSQQDLSFYTKDLNPKEEEVYLFECEVIGNIHENADLIKVGGK